MLSNNILLQLNLPGKMRHISYVPLDHFLIREVISAFYTHPLPWKGTSQLERAFFGTDHSFAIVNIQFVLRSRKYMLRRKICIIIPNVLSVGLVNFLSIDIVIFLRARVLGTCTLFSPFNPT